MELRKEDGGREDSSGKTWKGRNESEKSKGK